MVEGEMKEVSEADMLEALKIAHEAIKGTARRNGICKRGWTTVKREYSHEVNDEDLRKKCGMNL